VIGVPGNQDDHGLWIPPFDSLEDGCPTDSREENVEEDEIETILCEDPKGLPTARSQDDVVPLGLQRGPERVTDRVFIVHDQDPLGRRGIELQGNVVAGEEFPEFGASDAEMSPGNSVGWEFPGADPA
jgi:hypothetical protein